MADDLKSSEKIEELKNKIYSKTRKIPKKKRSRVQKTIPEAPLKWKEDENVFSPPKEKKSGFLESTMFRKLFFGAMAFFVLAIGFGLFMFFGESNTVSAENIDINILGNAFVSGGENLPLQIQLANKNSVGLENADLLIEYQRGAGIREDIYRERIAVGNIPAGSITSKLLDVQVFGGQGSTRDVFITLEYRVPGSNAIFFKQKIYTINISSAPVNLLVSGPLNSGSNQNLSFSIKAGLNTSENIKNLMVKVDYPRGFDFKSAVPAPTFGDNIWLLGDMNPGSERDITINGVVVAQSGEQRAFNVYIGQQKTPNERDIGVQFNTQSYIVSIQKPFLDTNITINGSQAPESSVTLGGTVKGEIDWRNSLGTRLTDVEIVAEISGDIVNFNSINTTGFFESATNKIIWNKQNNPAFADIRPGQSGKLSFSFSTLNPQNNATAEINISIRAKEPAVNNTFQDIRNFERRIVRVSTNMQMAGYALHYGGSLTNTGPIPPTPSQTTTYTIVWSLVNSLNDVVGAEVRGKLPIYVEWAGGTSPNSESITYNASTKEIIWNAGTVKKGSGSSAPPREIQFQVRFNPTTAHIGNTMNLVEGISFKGLDSSTNIPINGNHSSISHNLNRDLNYNFQNDKVQ